MEEKVTISDALLDSLEWFLDHLKVEKGASPHTVDAYYRDIVGIAEHVGCTLGSWSDLTVREMQLLDQYLAGIGVNSMWTRTLFHLQVVKKPLQRV